MSSASVVSAIAPVSMTLREKSESEFSRALGDSFKKYGFAVIADHGLDQDVLDNALNRAKQFFALPGETKDKYHIKDGGGQRGYVPFGQEKAKDADAINLKEFWHIGRSLPEGHAHADIMAPNIDVEEIESWDNATYAMFNALDELGLKILSSLSVYLGLDEHWFDDPIRDGNSILRLLHYPAQKEAPPEGSVRAAAHGDINVLTLLLGADEGGEIGVLLVHQRHEAIRGQLRLAPVGNGDLGRALEVDRAVVGRKGMGGQVDHLAGAY